MTIAAHQGGIEAPTVAGILGNPADMERRAHEDVVLEPIFLLDAAGKRRPGERPRFSCVSEAELLQDFDSRMHALGEIFRAHDGQDSERAAFAERLPRELRYIGNSEFKTGVDTIAEDWLRLLDESRTGELFVGLSNIGREDLSSHSLMFAEVMGAVTERNPDAGDHITGFELNGGGDLSARGKRCLAKSGLKLVDDWIVTGDQMDNTVDLARSEEVGFGIKDVEVHVLCVPNEFVVNGINGAACRAHFRRPFTPRRRGIITISGSHAAVDHGSGTEVLYLSEQARAIERSGNGNREVIEANRQGLSRPMLVAVSKAYRSNRREYADTSLLMRDQVEVMIAQEDRIAYWMRKVVSLDQVGKRHIF